MYDLRVWLFTCAVFLVIVAPLLLLLRWLYMLGQGIAVEHPAALNCPSCNSVLEPNWTHCPHCGAEIETRD